MSRRFALRLSRKHFAIPYMLFLVLFVIIPLVLLLVNAFMDDAGKFTFNNFAMFFTERYGWYTFLESLFIAFATTVICFLIGYPVAYILSNPKYNKSGVLIMLFILPMWINFLLRILAAKVLLEMLEINFGYGTVIFGMVYDFLPFMILPIYNTLTNIDRSYIEASEDLGAKPMQVFFKTIFPLSVPGIVSGVMMVFMPTISTFAISDILSNNLIRLFGSIINFSFEHNQLNLGSAFSIILLVIIGITILIGKRFNKNELPQVGTALW